MDPKRRRNRGPALALACVLVALSCSGEGGDPRPPDSPPRPTAAHGARLMHAHFHLPGRPLPPQPGMM